MRKTNIQLEPDGLLPLTNLPLGPTTAIAEHLALRHPIKVKTGRELWVLVERYRRKIASVRVRDEY